MLSAIIKNEWRNLLRNKSVVLLLVMLLLLATFTLWQSYSVYTNADHARKEATAQMRKKFTEQGEVNPHSAAHYGHFVYKPLSMLSVLDEGVNPYTGITLRLEGHRQNEALFSPAGESSSLIRFGQLNLSLALQVLLPLFILFICHNAVSSEKENGNLSLTLSQGNSLRKIIWGKTVAYSTIWVLFLTITIGLLDWLTGFSAEAERIVSVWLLYGIYYFIITALAVYVSACSRTSSNALLSLLFGWLICTVLLPKATANIGDNIVPLTTRIALDENIAEDKKNGLDGHDPRNERTQRFKDSLMTTYKADSVQQIPVNIDGITMQADEDYHNTVYDKHFGDVEATIHAQNNISRFSSFFNPYAAVSNLSTGLSGTDIFHHFDFTGKAETYRRTLIKIMNDEHAYGGSKTGEWGWTTDADFWEKIDDFVYQQPAVCWSVQNNYTELIALFFWILIVVLLIQFTSNRINILK